ncbi:putative ankyrin repeat protein RF_0381 [Anthonomus grandis grandis]|uniref:putative ankyrin repeat protein RF_0381 n=1 Tax=Anthonomus grandis grandis TaxID=2921223 RepID=UPI0021658154|nr:putative ankyrin repeat protein RF_0381 [Anthonomus grandis grandis]
MKLKFNFMDFDLFEVARNNCFSLLNIALDNLTIYNFEINSFDPKGYTLLHYAAEYGNLETVEKLLALKAFPDILNSKRQTPLHLACLNNHTGIVKLLLQHNANVNAKDAIGETPAIMATNLELFRTLVKNGADIFQKSKLKKTALHAACEKGLKAFVEHLISAGSDVNAVTVEGESPLMLAIKNAHLDVVKYLLKCESVNYHQVDYDGQNLIHFAVQQDTKEEILKELLTLDLNINQRDPDGLSPLHIASSNNNTKMIKLLIQNGADIHIKDHDGYTALHIAADHEVNAEAVETLVELGADVNAKTCHGDLPFHRACASGSEKGIMVLFSKGVLQVRNKYGYTPLMVAEECSRVNVRSLLKSLEGGRKKRVSFSR